MATTTASADDLLPSARDCQKQSAEIEAKKASDYIRHEAAVKAERKALFDQLSKPSGVSDEERMKKAAAIVRRAVNNARLSREVSDRRLAERDAGRHRNYARVGR